MNCKLISQQWFLFIIRDVLWREVNKTDGEIRCPVLATVNCTWRAVGYVPRRVYKILGHPACVRSGSATHTVWQVARQGGFLPPVMYPYRETTHGVQPHPRIVVCPSSFCFPLMIRSFIFVFCWVAGWLAGHLT